MDINLSKLQEIVEDREAGVLQSMGSQRVRYDGATEPNLLEKTLMLRLRARSEGGDRG